MLATLQSLSEKLPSHLPAKLKLRSSTLSTSSSIDQQHQQQEQPKKVTSWLGQVNFGYHPNVDDDPWSMTTTTTAMAANTNYTTGTTKVGDQWRKESMIEAAPHIDHYRMDMMAAKSKVLKARPSLQELHRPRQPDKGRRSKVTVSEFNRVFNFLYSFLAFF